MVLTSGACTLLNSLEGFSSGGLALPPEGGDAPVDAPSPPDGQSPGDGSGNEDRDAGPVDPCTGAVFCDRFQRDLVRDVNWTEFTTGGAKLELDTATSTSPTKSLLATIPAGAGPQAQITTVATHTDVDHVRIAFDLRVEALGRQSVIIRMTLIKPMQDSLLVDLYAVTDRLVVAEQVFAADGGASSGYAEYSVSSEFKVDTWQRWTMDVDGRSDAGVVVATVDGIEVVRKAMRNPVGTRNFRLVVGPVFAPNGPSQRLRYDDVAIFIPPP